MFRKFTMTALFAVLISLPSLMAHDADQHAGTPTEGQIVAVSKDSFDLKTADSTMKVTFTADTVFELGDAKVDKSHLMKGAKVSVFGTKLPSGSIAAKEVVMGHMEHGAGEHSH